MKKIITIFLLTFFCISIYAKTQEQIKQESAIFEMCLKNVQHEFGNNDIDSCRDAAIKIVEKDDSNSNFAFINTYDRRKNESKT